jgi:hypothetical protein
MSENMVRIHNLETGEITDREMTADELAQRDADLAAQAVAAAEAEAKATQKTALLEKLGITADEAVLLLS